MWESIAERAVCCGEFIVRTGCTVRTCAAQLGSSKSTVHKDVTERLAEIDPDLWDRVRAVLGVNLRERHLRGGAATRRKFEYKRKMAEQT